MAKKSNPKPSAPKPQKPQSFPKVIPKKGFGYEIPPQPPPNPDKPKK